MAGFLFLTGSKISRRLFTALVLVAVIPVFIMGFVAYRIAQNVLIENAYTHMETISQYHARNLDTWFGERLNDINVLSQLPPVRDTSRSLNLAENPSAQNSEKSALLSSILAVTRGQSPSYQSLSIFTPSGVVVASTDPNPAEVTMREHLDAFNLAKSSEKPVVGAVHRHEDGRWVIPLAVPILKPDGSTAAVALAVLDISGTLDPIMTDHSGLGSTGEAYLVNEDGRIITESKYLSRKEAMNRSFDSFGIRSALSHENGTAVYTNYMGREVVGSYRWLPRYKWALLVEMEKGEILSPLERIKTVVIATALLVGLMCLLVALVVSRRVSRPIVAVAEASREIARGHLDQRIPFKGDDEIGMLSESFNSMTEQLSIVIASLQQKEESLQKAYDDLVRAQAQLVQSEKMAAIGELVASVVHEMRNPLTSVKLNLQIIGRSLGKENPLSEHHQIALDQVGQLERMFSDLLDYSRPIAPERVPIHIEDLLEQSLQQLEAHIAEQHIRIGKSVSADLPPIMGDPDKIRQVLVNVIKNAFEAAGPGGEVEISADVEHSNGKHGVSVTISDNGAGISAQDLKRIFQPFFTTKKKGTGLGLAIVKKIMDAHGDSIGVSSREGAGTVVRLRFEGAGE